MKTTPIVLLRIDVYWTNTCFANRKGSNTMETTIAILEGVVRN